MIFLHAYFCLLYLIPIFMVFVTVRQYIKCRWALRAVAAWRTTGWGSLNVGCHFRLISSFDFRYIAHLMETFWRLRSGFYLRHDILNTAKALLWKGAWVETIQKTEGSGNFFREREGCTVALSTAIRNLSLSKGD